MVPVAVARKAIATPTEPMLPVVPEVMSTRVRSGAISWAPGGAGKYTMAMAAMIKTNTTTTARILPMGLFFGASDGIEEESSGIDSDTSDGSVIIHPPCE